AEGGSPVVRQEYLKSSLAVRTTFPGLTVTDFLDCSGGRPGQRAGRSELVRVLEGAGAVRIEFAPRVDFGRIATRLKVVEGGIAVEDAPDPMVLRAPGVAWSLVQEGKHQTAIG